MHGCISFLFQWNRPSLNNLWENKGKFSTCLLPLYPLSPVNSLSHFTLELTPSTHSCSLPSASRPDPSSQNYTNPRNHSQQSEHIHSLQVAILNSKNVYYEWMNECTKSWSGILILLFRNICSDFKIQLKRDLQLSLAPTCGGHHFFLWTTLSTLSHSYAVGTSCPYFPLNSLRVVSTANNNDSNSYSYSVVSMCKALS